MKARQDEDSAEALERLATRYVARYATTRVKLITYLKRKAQQRGYEGDTSTIIESIVDKMERLKWLDDTQYAQSKIQSLARKGYGVRRITQSLHHAGIARNEQQNAFESANYSPLEAAHAYARRKKLGPYADKSASPEDMKRDLARMLRAGHSYEIVRLLLHSGEESDS
jgi:regulatory protein